MRSHKIVKSLGRSFTPLAILLLAVLVACNPSPQTTRAPGAGTGTYKVGKPYQVDGIWYYPHEDLSYDETGIASWYGEAFHGRYTANGEVFDLNGLTAAHHTLPLPSIVQVTNLENGRSLTLRVNDRGPFARGRIIDVSRQAAKLLGFEQQGTAKVRVRVLDSETLEAQAVARRNGVEEGAQPRVQVAQAAPRTSVDAQSLAPLPGNRGTVQQPAEAPHPPRTTSTEAPAPSERPLSGQVTQAAARPNAKIYVQAGAFAQMANARHTQERVSSLGSVSISSTRVNGQDLFRVRIGPVANVEAADKLLSKVLGAGLVDAQIIVD
ncbi:MAG TPA: septal ring lytic transglycosylase RlpA family protein [Stellaceae bacterium]|nr:septal ring lytic transglycosylase RlpA family protein [Stellaceae bacterium]